MMYHNQTKAERLKEFTLTTFFGRIPTMLLGIGIRNLIYKSLFKRMGNPVYIQEGAKFFGAKCIEIGEIVHIFKGVSIDARGINNHIYIKEGVVLNQGANIRALNATNIDIGERTFVGQNVCIIGLGNIKIGKDCVIADNSGIFALHHVFSDTNQNITYNEVSRKGVVIEDDCWLGHGVTVLNGVTIGKGSVIGTNSVVTEDIPPYSNAAGIPAFIA
jgi:acetyltransferase-like isoleucine patch superfamily enzyme